MDFQLNIQSLKKYKYMDKKKLIVKENFERSRLYPIVNNYQATGICNGW